MTSPLDNPKWLWVKGDDDDKNLLKSQAGDRKDVLFKGTQLCRKQLAQWISSGLCCNKMVEVFGIV
ncbi:hypothetical protein M8C21_003993 [Ambrosia artemisiifolia]|uniref:Uncharacterized protein n=1 Tax=Ambrosia artemisiifolia TaxID=4212 RepID=A0AAD5CSN2_AMBAR|nr:hypothetical protein M8C21_003993 [Ambrosia artemisiifolia]